MKFSKPKKKWMIITGVALAIISLGLIFFYQRNDFRVFTKSEYIKEVIIQNQNFENLVDEFLDKVANYRGTTSDNDKLQESANTLEKFVKSLDKKLSPKVPHESRQHYANMMKVYNQYLDSIELYKNAVPKNHGEERSKLIQEAVDKLSEARKAMKNLE